MFEKNLAFFGCLYGIFFIIAWITTHTMEEATVTALIATIASVAVVILHAVVPSGSVTFFLSLLLGCFVVLKFPMNYGFGGAIVRAIAITTVLALVVWQHRTFLPGWYLGKG